MKEESMLLVGIERALHGGSVTVVKRRIATPGRDGCRERERHRNPEIAEADRSI
jgi:hypothetical protein